MPIVRISDKAYRAVQDYAEPLKDSFDLALRKILGLEDPYGDMQWSAIARLARLGDALAHKNENAIAKELEDIRRAYEAGVFQ